MREESTGELECENIESYHIDLEKLRKQLKDPAKNPDLAPLVKKIEEYINELENVGKKYAYSADKSTQTEQVKDAKKDLGDKFKEFDADGEEIDFIEGIKQQLSQEVKRGRK